MKKFKLRTEKYCNKMQKFIENTSAEEIIHLQKRSTAFVAEFSVARRDDFCEGLLGLLMDIAEGENPVYVHSAKLREMAQSLRVSPLFGRELRRLSEFISHSRELNIDGYITFRMSEFQEKLDTMIYSLVKKIKFGV